MRLIIAGSRKLNSEAVREWLPNLVAHMCKVMCLPEPTVILSGACPTGVDVAGEAYAADLGLPVERFPADWKGMGKAAGPHRNRLPGTPSGGSSVPSRFRSGMRRLGFRVEGKGR